MPLQVRLIDSNNNFEVKIRKLDPGEESFLQIPFQRSSNNYLKLQCSKDGLSSSIKEMAVVETWKGPQSIQTSPVNVLKHKESISYFQNGGREFNSYGHMPLEVRFTHLNETPEETRNPFRLITFIKSIIVKN